MNRTTNYRHCNHSDTRPVFSLFPVHCHLLAGSGSQSVNTELLRTTPKTPKRRLNWVSRSSLATFSFQSFCLFWENFTFDFFFLRDASHSVIHSQLIGFCLADWRFIHLLYISTSAFFLSHLRILFSSRDLNRPRLISFAVVYNFSTRLMFRTWRFPCSAGVFSISIKSCRISSWRALTSLSAFFDSLPK